MTSSVPRAGQSPDAPDLVDDLMLLARLVESEAEIAARPGQLDRLDAIANRLRALSGIEAERVAARAAPGAGSAPWDLSLTCGDSTGPNGVGGPCVFPPGHPHMDGIGGQWTAVPASLDPDVLARALHDADCGCSDYDDVEDPRYIQAVRTALAAPGEREHVAAGSPGVLWMAARYAYGRSTYAVQEVCDALTRHADQLRPWQRERMAAEIEAEALPGAMECDVRSWRQAVTALRGEPT